MKIAFLLGQFPLPSETFVLDQIVSLIDRGHEVTIVADRPTEYTLTHPKFSHYGLAEKTFYTLPRVRGSRVQRALAILQEALRKSRSPSWTLQLYHAVNSSRWPKQSWSRRRAYLSLALAEHVRTFDIIYCHFGMNGLDALALREAGLISGKIVTVFHGYDITRYLKKNGPHVYDKLFTEGDHFLPISRNWQNKLIELGCPADKITVHHMGVDVDSLAFSPRSLPETGPIRLLCVARLVEKKGVSYALEAFAQLLGDYPQLHYTIIGDGPLREPLEGLAQELGISQNVTFLGLQPHREVVAQMARAHIFLLPSVTAQDGDQEGIPVVLMEAMALGLPIVSTVHSGIPELIENCVTGVTVPEKDVAELVAGLRYLLEHPEIWSDMCFRARQQIRQNFNSKSLDDKLVVTLQATQKTPDLENIMS